MRLLVQTDDIPARERFEFYREYVSHLPVPLDIRSKQPAAFSAKMSLVELGGLSVVSLSSQTAVPYEVRRTRSLIRRSDPEAYRLVLNVHGRSRLRHHHEDALLGPGDLALYDTSLPFEGWRGSHPSDKWVMATFPRALLPLPADTVRQLLGIRLPADTGVGALAAEFLVRVAHEGDGYQPADAQRVSTILLDLLALLLERNLDPERATATDSYRRVLLLRIYAFIEQRLGDSNLTPETIAAAHHISTRHLHRLFHADGSSVAGWIKTRRLDRCRHDFADGTLDRWSIGTIAARWGFTDAPHFSRIFRAAYGISPRGYRQQQRTLVPSV